jgi:hypothetical protein
LFLKNGAGGVHDQLWQKSPVEETEEIPCRDFFLRAIEPALIEIEGCACGSKFSKFLRVTS